MPNTLFSNDLVELQHIVVFNLLKQNKLVFFFVTVRSEIGHRNKICWLFPGVVTKYDFIIILVPSQSTSEHL